MPLFPCHPPARAPRPTLGLGVTLEPPVVVARAVVDEVYDDGTFTITNVVRVEPKFVGFECRRPAGPWGESSGLSLASTAAGAAFNLLMFSSHNVAPEHLPTIERVLDVDGTRLREPARVEDLVAIAVAAAVPAHALKFPKRLERLVEHGRLPRCG